MNFQPNSTLKNKTIYLRGGMIDSTTLLE